MKFNKIKLNVFVCVGIILLSILFSQNIFAYEVKNKKLIQIYEMAVKKAESNYATHEEQIKYFIHIREKLQKALKYKNFSKQIKILLNDLLYLNKKQIQFLENQKGNSTVQDMSIIYKNKKEIDGIKISKLFKNISYNEDHIFLKGGVWYSYNVTQSAYLLKSEVLDLPTLKYNSINPENDLLFLTKKGNIGFASHGSYKKVKLITDNLISNIPNKYNFLKAIKDDKKFHNTDTEIWFYKLKKHTEKITKWKSKDDIIKIIYNDILSNTHYTENVDFTDLEALKTSNISSGIHTYIKGNGICEGYAKLFLYMLSFGGIQDVKLITGQVIDAPDFPDIGHAWVRIGDQYYDPTFDDPVGLGFTKKFHEYKFFALPYDLFYSNRFLYKDTPEFLKNISIEKRTLYTRYNVLKLLEKYKDSNYTLLKPFLLRKSYGIPQTDAITLEHFRKILPIFEVKNWKFKENNKIKTITSIGGYYPLTDYNIEILLEQLNYELDGYYFFKWYTSENTFEYRLGEKVVTR